MVVRTVWTGNPVNPCSPSLLVCVTWLKADLHRNTLQIDAQRGNRGLATKKVPSIVSHADQYFVLQRPFPPITFSTFRCECGVLRQDIVTKRGKKYLVPVVLKGRAWEDLFQCLRNGRSSTSRLDTLDELFERQFTGICVLVYCRLSDWDIAERGKNSIRLLLAGSPWDILLWRVTVMYMKIKPQSSHRYFLYHSSQIGGRASGPQSAQVVARLWIRNKEEKRSSMLSFFFFWKQFLANFIPII